MCPESPEKSTGFGIEIHCVPPELPEKISKPRWTFKDGNNDTCNPIVRFNHPMGCERDKNFKIAKSAVAEWIRPEAPFTT